MDKLKKTFILGLSLAIPMLIVFYVFSRVIKATNKVMEPLVVRMGIEKALVEYALVFVSVLLVFFFILLLGVLTRFALVSNIRKNIEALVLYLIPSLNYLKAMAQENLEGKDGIDSSWKSVLLHYENTYIPSFVIEEKEELITLFLLKGVSLQEGEILITHRSDVHLIPIASHELHKCHRSFGKGYLSIILANEPNEI